MKARFLIAIFLLSFPLLQAQEKTTESFEGTYFPPKDWTVRYANPAPTVGNFMCLSTDEHPYGGGEKSFRFSSNDNKQGAPYEQWLISPELNCAEADTFSFRYYVPGYGSRYFRVGWSSTGTADGDFTYTESKRVYDENYEGYSYWDSYSKTDLPSGTKYVCIKYEATDNQIYDYFYVDMVKLPPLRAVRLSAPVNLACEAESGTISWTEISSAVKWEVAVVKTTSVDEENLSGVEVAQNRFTPSALEPLTDYVVYVRSKDEMGVSAWSSPLFFRTGCPEYFTVPFFEGFENLVADDILPDCQSVETSGYDRFKCIKELIYTSPAWYNEKPHTGKGYACFLNHKYSEQTENRYFSPAIRMEAGRTYKLSFWWITDENLGFDTLALGVQAGENGSVNFLAVQENPHTAYYREMCAYYTPDATQDNRMVVYFKGTYDEKRDLKAERLCFDDLQVEDVTGEPSVSSLALEGKAARSLSVVWNENVTPSTRQIALGIHTSKADFKPEDSVLSLSLSEAKATLTLDGQGRALRPDTEYDVYVRIADGDKQSVWAGPLTVRTAKDTLSIPFVEDCAGLTGKGLLPDKVAWISHLGGSSSDGMTTPISNDSWYKQEGHGDSKYILFQPQGSVSDTVCEWIILRGAVLEQEESYDFSAWFRSNEKEGVDTIEFWVGESPEPSGMTTQLACHTAYLNTEYEQISATYENMLGNIPQYFAIRLKGHGGGWSDGATLCIDDISVQQTPSCKPVKSVGVSEIEGTSARVSWNGSAQKYEVAYCKGESFNFDDSDTVTVADGKTSVELSGLEPQTFYWLRVRGYCEAEGLFSAWSESKSFTTICLPNHQYPLHENFEDFGNGCWLTTGWSNGEEDVYASWKVHVKGSSDMSDAEPMQGEKAIRFNSNTLLPSQYGDLISPTLESDGATHTGIEFYWWNAEDCNGKENIKPWLYLMADMGGENPQAIDSVRLCGCERNTSDYKRYQRVFDFPISGLTLRTFGANATEYNFSNTELDSLTLDLFNAEELPSMAGLQASVRENTVTLTWDGAAAQTSSFRANGSYVVLRDGVKVGETSLNSYEDSLLQKGEYTYGVVYVTRAGMPADTAYTETEVTVNTLRVTVALNGEGSVRPLPGTYFYIPGSKITLAAEEVSGRSYFAGWKCGADTVKENPLEVTLVSDTLLAALFSDITYPVTVEVEGEGTVRPEPGIHVCKSLDTLFFEAEATNGSYRFEKWVLNGDSTIGEASFRWIVTDTLHAKAIFSRPVYKLTMRVQGEGTVEPAAGSHDVLAGDTVHLRAVPSEGHRFVRWTVSNQTVTDSLYLFVMERATTVTGYFEENPVTPPDPPVANEANENFSVRLYPNPVRNTLYIEASEIVDEVILYSTGGNEVLRAYGKAASLNVFVENIPQGLYLVRLRLRDGYEKIERIIIQ
ncbi:MAG: choice-of-anchor J domain-containing protein [Bacteroides sp.]|nr:choice-of-anchor J domain-containing protein [Bacteroides sp.]MCM1085530.1 choice-of-anchor J domain-containing protein [Bacteroides sp.]